MNFGPFGVLIELNSRKKFAVIRSRVFVLRGAENGYFLYLWTSALNTVQSADTPIRDNIRTMRNNLASLIVRFDAAV
jgi:hypothetical protein